MIISKTILKLFIDYFQKGIQYIYMKIYRNKFINIKINHSKTNLY